MKRATFITVVFLGFATLLVRQRIQFSLLTLPPPGRPVRRVEAFAAQQRANGSMAS